MSLSLRFFAMIVLSASTVLAGNGQIRRASEPIPGTYLVVLKSVAKADVPRVAEQLVGEVAGELRLTFNNAFSGFSARLSEEQALRIARHPLVQVVEENSRVYLAASQSLPTNDVLWHLDRIDQTNPTTQGDDAYNYCERASQVIAYVIDTGINKAHGEFQSPSGSRVLNGVKFANDHHVWPGESNDNGTLPCGGWTNAFPDSYSGGHGTSVASVIAGNTVGVAKEARLVPIRVFQCNGYSETEWVAWGVDWIRSSQNPYRNVRPALVNMSLWRFDTDPLIGALEHAINGLILDDINTGWTGIPVIVSANNQNSANSRTSPARMAYRNGGFVSSGRGISVGGTHENDTRWTCQGYVTNELCWNESNIDGFNRRYGSNFGTTVDIYAPAHRIESAHISCAGCYRSIYESRSGTSFSAAIVSGVVARLLQAEQSLTPTQVWDRLQDDATRTLAPIDPETGNNLLVRRPAAPVCNPELP